MTRWCSSKTTKHERRFRNWRIDTQYTPDPPHPPILVIRSSAGGRDDGRRESHHALDQRLLELAGAAENERYGSQRQDGKGDEQGCDGGDGRIHLEDQLVEHLLRHGVVFAGDEGGDDYLVEAADEGEDPGGEDTGRQVGQHHP